MHKYYNHPSKLYVCNRCGLSKTTFEHFKSHWNSHTDYKPFKCKLCQYDSNRKDNLILHLKRIHEKEDDFNENIERDPEYEKNIFKTKEEWNQLFRIKEIKPGHEKPWQVRRKKKEKKILKTLNDCDESE